MAETAATHSTEGRWRSAMLLATLLAGLALLPRLFRAPDRLAEGHSAPSFRLGVILNREAVGGRTSISPADLQGHPVLLAFWATWCEPCRFEAPILDQAARRWREQGVIIVGVDIDGPGQGDPRSFAEARGLTYPIVQDASGEASRLYSVDVLPTLVALSRDGNVVTVRTGMTSSDEVDRIIRLSL